MKQIKIFVAILLIGTCFVLGGCKNRNFSDKTAVKKTESKEFKPVEKDGELLMPLQTTFREGGFCVTDYKNSIVIAMSKSAYYVIDSGEGMVSTHGNVVPAESMQVYDGEIYVPASFFENIPEIVM